MALKKISDTVNKINMKKPTLNRVATSWVTGITAPSTVTTPTTPVTPVRVNKPTATIPMPTKKPKPVDTFGAVSGQSTLGQTVTPWARLSTGQTVSQETVKPVELGNLNVFGEQAKWAEATAPWTLVKRNDAIVQNLLSQWVTDQLGIKNYLEWQEWFTNSTPEEQANTLRALTEQMGVTPWATAPTPTTTEWQTAQDVVWLARAKDAADLATKTQQDMQFAKDMKAKELEIKDLEWNTIKIQASQRLKEWQRQLDNMKQRYAYLGSQWQPWVSSVQLDAISKQVGQAEQTYAQMKQMEQNAAQMRELGIKYDAELFEKEMSDAQYKLDQQVNKAVQDVVNKFNQDWQKLDTLEEVKQVAGTMMQELDKSIANIAISNQADRQLILDRYNEVIKTNEEFVKNKNTVNEDMSAVLWYYVDGNGNPVLNSQWLPVQIPPEAPMKPIFQDGQLITFSTGKNGEIIATPQQVLQSKWEPRKQGTWWTFYRTWADWQLEFANGKWQRVSWWGTGWGGWGMWTWIIPQWWVWWATDLIDYNVKFKNQDQSNAFSYATRMIESSDIINQVSDDVANMSKGEYIYQKSLGKLPYWSSLQSETIQKQEQAEQNFINAILRKESGAAIAPSEYTNAQKQYFPQPWDSAAVLEQKRKNRLTSLKWISAATGNQKALNWAINYVSQWKPATPTPTVTTPTKPVSTWGGRRAKK